MKDSAQPSSAGHATCEFMGLDFDVLDQQAMLGRLEARHPSAPFAYVVTPNVDHLVRLHRAEADLWGVYDQAWLTVCDSQVLSMLAAYSGLDLPVIAGSDLTIAMFERVIRPDDRVVALGGSPELAAELRRRYGLSNLVHFEPPFGFADNETQLAEAVDFVVNAQARYAFLAVGSPRQEIVAARAARAGATGVGLCVGASLEFLVGTRRRAPRFIRGSGFEWLFRLAMEPTRLWRRYLVDGPRIFLLERAWRQARRSEAAAGSG